jgi:hypothetical protein
MCIKFKDLEFVRKQFNTAMEHGIEILELEMDNGSLTYRDLISTASMLKRCDKESKRGQSK